MNQVVIHPGGQHRVLVWLPRVLVLMSYCWTCGLWELDGHGQDHEVIPTVIEDGVAREGARRG